MGKPTSAVDVSRLSGAWTTQEPPTLSFSTESCNVTRSAGETGRLDISLSWGSAALLRRRRQLVEVPGLGRVWPSPGPRVGCAASSPNLSPRQEGAPRRALPGRRTHHWRARGAVSGHPLDDLPGGRARWRSYSAGPDIDKARGRDVMEEMLVAVSPDADSRLGYLLLAAHEGVVLLPGGGGRVASPARHR